ncbi:MAG: acyl carrier protein [Salinivirgaceae bacterium]|nr:acyl carrier protein [Salinivirgaceae bacterium]
MERIKKIIANVFEIQINKISDDFSKDDCDNWDSITHLELIQQLETEFNIDLELMETLDMISLRNIETIIKSKL